MGSVNKNCLKDRGGLLNCSIRDFWLELTLNFVLIGTKYAFFSPTFLKFAGSRHLKTAIIYFVSSKRELAVLTLALRFSWY